jgi:undecaprenyl-diphosphatase
VTPPGAKESGLASAAVRRDVVSLGVVTVALTTLCVFTVDQRIALFVRELPRWARETADALTTLGGAGLWTVAFAAVAAAGWAATRHGLLRWGLFGLAVLWGTGLVINIIKPLLGRARPSQLFAVHDTGWFSFQLSSRYGSFPSGHAATIATVAAVLWLAMPRFWPAWLTLGIVVATTRVFTLSHYLSDVLAGGYVGACLALVAHHLAVRQGWLGSGGAA